MVFEPGVEIVGDVKFVVQGEDTKTVPAGTYQDREVAL
jgi:hypothetical protein